MSKNKIYKGDIGTEFIIDTGSDITESSVHRIIVMRPKAKSPIIWEATVVETTKLRYVTIDGDINKAGNWKIQSYVVIPGWSGHGETVEFPVYDLMK